MASNPNAIRTIIQASRQRGADPVAMLATALQETGGNIRYNAVGDNGTSFGVYQYHQGGALGSRTPQWAMSPQEIYDEAGRFAQYQIHGGKGAAALQRPADPTGYAAGVDRYVQLARQLYHQYNGGATPANGPAPGGVGTAGAPQGLGAGPSPQQLTAPMVPFKLDPSGMNLGLRFLQGATNDLAARTRTTPGTVQMPALPQFKIQAPQPISTIDVPLNQPGHPNEQAAGPIGSRVVGLARQYLGTAYKWGGSTPQTGFDCSGFAQWLYAQQGVKLPRVAADQFNVGRHVTMNQLQPGDLVFFRDASGIHHEGIAISGGKFIHAPHTGDVVKISSLSDPFYAQQFAGGRRIG